MALEVRQNLAAPPDSANRSATSWATSSPMALARLTARTAHDPCVSHPLDVADPSGPILVIQSYASTDISTSVIGMPRIKNCLRAMRVACFVPHHPSPLEAGFLYSACSPRSPFIGPTSLVVLPWTPLMQPSTCVAPYTCTQAGPRRRSASTPTPSKPMRPTWERSRVRSRLATITTICDGAAIPLR